MYEGRGPNVNINSSLKENRGKGKIEFSGPKVVVDKGYSGSNPLMRRRRGPTRAADEVKGLRLLKQVIICVAIFALVLAIKNSSIPLAQSTQSGLRYLLTTETDFSPLFHKVVRVAGQWSNVDWPVLDLRGAEEPRAVISKVPSEISPELPVRGKVITGYGWIRDERSQLLVFHRGLDLEAVEGEKVEAVADGRILRIFTDNEGHGSVIILHDKNLATQYTNMCNVAVAEGETVEKSQAIGEVEAAEEGLTHLHYELIQYGKPVNPLNMLFTF